MKTLILEEFDLMTTEYSENQRPSWDEYFLDIAEKVAQRSTCLRLKVGALLVIRNKIIFTGYNGAPSGSKQLYTRLTSLVTLVLEELAGKELQTLSGGIRMHLPTANYWAWDIETAENGQITDYPTMLSSSNGKDAFVAIGERNIRDLACALRDSGSQLVTWNGWAFDEPKMKNWGIEMPASDDAMAMAYLDDETQALGLESCAVKY